MLELGRLEGYEVGLKFKYYELSSEEKAKIVESLCEELRPIEGVVFAYIHGGS